MSALCARLLVAALAVLAGHGHCQDFYYVEPGVASCPAAPKPIEAAPQSVARGIPLSGRIRVDCGFSQGSYTVTLNSSDPSATIAPKSFLVNFGRIVGSGVFAVTFSSVGLQSVSTSITSNMGSPAVQGHFVSRSNEFKVVSP